MANIKSAKKRIKVIVKKTAINKAKKSEIKTFIKKFEQAIEAENMELAQETFKVLEKKLAQASGHNLLHKNAAARRVSSMQRRMNQLAQS